MPNKSLSLSLRQLLGSLAVHIPFFPLSIVFFSSSTPHLPLCFFPLPIKSPISPIDCSSLFLCLTHLPNLLFKPFSTRCPNNNPIFYRATSVVMLLSNSFISCGHRDNDDLTIASDGEWESSLL